VFPVGRLSSQNNRREDRSWGKTKGNTSRWQDSRLLWKRRSRRFSCRCRIGWPATYVDEAEESAEETWILARLSVTLTSPEAQPPCDPTANPSISPATLAVCRNRRPRCAKACFAKPAFLLSRDAPCRVALFVWRARQCFPVEILITTRGHDVISRFIPHRDKEI